MAIDVLIKRTHGGFVPIDANQEAVMGDLPMGKPLRAKITVARSNPQNRWFHKVLRELFDNQSLWPTEKLFKDAVKIALGFADEYTIAGKTYFEVRSIAFHKMDGHEFSQFVDRFVELVCTRIIPQMNEQTARAMLTLLDADTGVLGERLIDRKSA